MEKIKLLYLHSLLVRKPTPQTTLENFIREIRSMEGYCGACYDGQINASSDEFVEMMVVDTCFIIELFRKSAGEVPKEKNDPVFIRSWMRTALINDLLLLENQLPWRVLNCLFDLTWEIGKLKLHDLTLEYFKDSTFGLCPGVNGELENKHVLDFLRNCSLGSIATKQFKDYLRRKSFPSAQELSDAGIIFKCRNRNDGMFNIVFQMGPRVLEIPPIRLQNAGLTFLRNLIAYEQCAPVPGVICSYVLLLGELIRTDEDVKFLMHREIIQGISSEQGIATSINSLSANLGICSSPYTVLYENVNRYMSTRWIQWVALLNGYFKNPLDLFNLTYGVILVVILTIVQTYYSVASYNKQQ